MNFRQKINEMSTSSTSTPPEEDDDFSPPRRIETNKDRIARIRKENEKIRGKLLASPDSNDQELAKSKHFSDNDIVATAAKKGWSGVKKVGSGIGRGIAAGGKGIGRGIAAGGKGIGRGIAAGGKGIVSVIKKMREDNTPTHYEQVINLIRESQALNEGEARIKRLGKAIDKAVKKGDKTKEAKLRSAAKRAEAKLDRRDDAGMAKAAKERPYDYSTTHPDRNVRRAELWKKNLDKKWKNDPKLKKSKRHFPKTDSYENMRRHSNNGDRY
jgi:hypothetical protein